MKKQIYIVATTNDYMRIDHKELPAEKLIRFGLDIVKATADPNEAERCFEKTCERVREYYGDNTREESNANRWHHFYKMHDKETYLCSVTTWIKDIEI